MTTIDIAIKCGTLITLEKNTPVVKTNKALLIKGDTIDKICDWEDSFSSNAKKFIDASDKIVSPGLINGHSHLPMTLFRGLSDDLPLERWLSECIFPIEGKLLNRDFCKVGTELAMLESIRLGTTCIYDMYYFEDTIAEVVDRAGMRGVLGQNYSSFPSPDDPNKDGSTLRLLESLVEKFGSHPRIQPMVSPHAPYTCSDKTLIEARDLALKYDIPYGIHVSETKKELEDSLEEFGKTPVKRLYDIGVMDAKCIFAHGVHIQDEDMPLLKEKNTSVIYNAESNMKLGSGAAPIPKLLKHGIKVGMGTDGCASNNDLNMFKEMDTATKLQKVFLGDNTAMTALDAFKLATSDGAKALGFNDTGALVEGMKADMIILDCSEPWMKPIHNVFSSLVYSSTGAEVETTIVAGKVLMENKEFKTLNASDIYNRAEFYRKQITETVAK